MTDNPFAAPDSPGRVTGVLSGKGQDVVAVARYQKIIMVCILVYLLAVMAQLLMGLVGISPNADPARSMILGIMLIAMGVGVLAAWLCGAVCVLLLAMKVYHPAVGVLMAILALIPCVGLLILLLVNGRATKIIRDNGFKVGLLGANVAEIQAALAPTGDSLDDE